MTKNHTVRTAIVDVNGKNTHVYKLPEGADFDGPELTNEPESRNVTYFEVDGRDYDIDETDSGYAVYLNGDHVTDFSYAGDAEDHESLSDTGIQALENAVRNDD